MITSLNHTGIIVQDLDEMVRFYTEDLGLNVTARYESLGGKDGDHAGIPGSTRIEAFVDESHQIELIYYAEPPANPGHLDKQQFGSTHICFLVDDLNKAYAELLAKGVRFVTEPNFATTPEGDEWGAVYFQDPEGNWLEFIQL